MRTPKEGEIWKVRGMPSGNIPKTKKGPKLGDVIGMNQHKIRWSYLNDQEVTIVNVTEMIRFGQTINLIMSYVGEESDAWFKCTANYMTFLRDKEIPTTTVVGTKMKCCSPSVGMCSSCKADFALGQLAMGRKYNPVFKMWENPRR